MRPVNQSFDGDQRDLKGKTLKSSRILNKSLAERLAFAEKKDRSAERAIEQAENSEHSRNKSLAVLNRKTTSRNQLNKISKSTAEFKLPERTNETALTRLPPKGRTGGNGEMQTPVKDKIPNTRRSRALYSMHSEQKNNNSRSPFEKSSKKLFERSSAAYGNFASAEDLDKALIAMKNRKNYSIAF